MQYHFSLKGTSSPFYSGNIILKPPITILASFRQPYRLRIVPRHVSPSDQFGTYFSRNYFEGKPIEIDDKLKWKARFMSGGWISWKNDRLIDLGFYLDQDPPIRTHPDIDDTPPRLVLREDSHQNKKVPPKNDFPTKGHLEWKIYLQDKIEQVAQGRASGRFLSGVQRHQEREEAMKKWEQLATDDTKGIRKILDEEIFFHDISEARHLHLMQKILAKKNPFADGLIDTICKEIVRALISQSKTTFPSDEDVYWTMVDSGNHKEILDFAESNGINIKPKHVRKQIQGNLNFQTRNKYDEKKFAKTVRKLGLTPAQYRAKIKIILTIDKLVTEVKSDRIPIDWKYPIIWLPAMTFGKNLSDKLSEILCEALEEVKKYIIDEDCGSEGTEDEEKVSTTDLMDSLKSGETLSQDELMESRKSVIVRGLPKLGLTTTELKDLERLTLPLVWDSDQLKFVNDPPTVQHPNGKQGGFGSRKSLDIEYSPEVATHHNATKLAGNIIVVLQENGIIDHRPMSDKEYRHYYYDGDEAKKRPEWSSPNLVYFTEKLRSGDKCNCPSKSTCYCFPGITKSSFSDFKKREEHAIYRWLRGESDRWMYSPPEDHNKIQTDAPKAGGLLREKSRRLTTPSNRLYEDEFQPPTPRCKLNKEIILAMNTLQDTQWEINLHLLATLFDIVLVGGTKLSSVYPDPSEWIDKKKKLIKKIQPKRKFEDVFYHKTSNETNDERRMILEYAKRLIDHNANVFWHSWVCDSRGRLYPRCATLSPHGDDTSKGLIRFKHWKPLGDDGILWLYVHVQNLMQGVENKSWKDGIAAGKKQTIDQKIAWVKDNLGELRKIANDPSEYANLLELRTARKPKSEVFQRLAAILELDRVHSVFDSTGEDWTKVTSGLPIHMDASCNGYQHISTLLRAGNLAKLVNVIGDKDKPPNDFYQDVADEARKDSGEQHVCDSKCPNKCVKGRVRKFIEEVLLDELTQGKLRKSKSWRIDIGNDANYFRNKLGSDYDSWDKLVQQTIDQLFTRTVVKKPIIIRAYGGTDFDKCLAGRNGEGAKRKRLVPKTEEELEKDEKTLKDMPKDYRKALERFLQTRDRDERKELSEQLKKFVKKYDKSGGKDSKDWEKALRENILLSIWNEGSALQQALVDSQPLDSTFDVPQDLDEKALNSAEKEKYDIRSRRQAELTRFMKQAIKDAIKKVTEGAFEEVERPLKEFAKEQSGLHPGIQWHLPKKGTDRFEVNHYKIKEFQNETRQGNPMHPNAVYRARMPDWYKDDRTHTNIQKRMKELYDQSIFIVHPSTKRDFRKLSKKKGEKKYKSEAKAFLEKYSPPTPNEDIEEIRKILSHFEISLLRYHEDESERIDYDKDKFEKLVDEFSEKHSRVPDENEMKEIRAKCHNLAKSLPPNFIHSIDAFHMRKSINLLEDRVKSSDQPQLSFWSVHDAFGTHACDVAEMRKVVRETFHEIHKEIDFNEVFKKDWIQPKNQPKKKDPKLVLSDILNAGYIIG